MIHLRHISQMDGYEERMAERAKAARASRAGIKGNCEALKTSVEGRISRSLTIERRPGRISEAMRGLRWAGKQRSRLASFAIAIYFFRIKAWSQSSNSGLISGGFSPTESHRLRQPVCCRPAASQHTSQSGSVVSKNYCTSHASNVSLLDGRPA